MAAEAPGFQRISIGFVGGQTIPARVTTADLASLQKAFKEHEGWHELACEDGTVQLDLAQVQYVRVDADSSRVGFGA